MSKYNFNYDFTTINYSDFELEIKSEIKNNIFEQLFLEVFKKLPVSVQAKIKGKRLNEFDLNPKYYNYLKFNLKSIIEKINEQLKIDKRKIVDYWIEKARYTKEADKWLFKVNTKGNYIETA